VLWIGRKPVDSIDPLIKLTIESAGGELHYFQCDIADVEKLERVVQTMRCSFGTIHGVFHSGMHLVDGLIGSLSERSFREGMACKVDGSVNLVHSLLKDDLDFFVFFSSAGAFGSDRAIASYAAAVSFEDAFALSIARETRTVIRVINWGYWGEVGTGAKAGLRERFASEGLMAFTVAEGLEAIRRIITSDIEQVMPITADPKFLRQLGVLTQNALQAVLPTKKPAPSLKNIRKQLMQLSEA
jgi:polyketide synthase PksJ